MQTRKSVTVDANLLAFRHISSMFVKVDDSQITGDGFMLNLTFVLQKLALPIDVERVKAIFAPRRSRSAEASSVT